VLVEALPDLLRWLDCTPPGHLKVVGPTGTVYTPSPQHGVAPIFGSFFANGQVWGYLGVVVPNSESSLRLVLSQSGEDYYFALQ
jgi:hypothetical protein